MLPQKPYKILLIGDSCIDRYTYGFCTRISPEAPVPILELVETISQDGMCLNTLNNLKSFDGLEIEFLTNDIKSIKTRYIDKKTKQQILRVDEDTISSPIKFEDIKNINDYDCVVISDYNKGYISNEFLNKLTSSMGVPIFIDSKKHILPKENCFIKINKQEYELLQDKNDHSNVIITLGAEGAMYQSRIYPTKPVEKSDVIGAGDTFLAAMVYKYMTTKDMEKSIQYANVASCFAVSHHGTYVLQKNDINILHRY